MTSIMDRHATDTYRYHEGCGGTILSGGAGEQAHDYCDRCGAFRYDSADEPFPSGSDRDANRRAYDDGDDRSPDA